MVLKGGSFMGDFADRTTFLSLFEGAPLSKGRRRKKTLIEIIG
jgi:hypothetical protein